ncbi:MAG: polymer-forming cytoskeletal protein [bacterium]|nr:polymer-forming cytoskeletal protein [bacterium]
MKKTILTACFILLLMPLTASAYAIKKGDSVYVPKEETIEGNLYAVGSNLTIEGKVTGDIICAGQSINISGEVAGDIICAGQSINISGQIGGNLRLIGNSINFSGQTARNAMLFGGAIVAAASSSIGWDALIAGNALESRGEIGRDLHGYLGKAVLAGKIGQNVKLNFGPKNANQPILTVGGAAQINGNLNYTAEKNATIESGAIIKGQTTHNLPIISAKKSNFINLSWWWGNLFAVFSALIVGLVLISFWREPIIKITALMLSRVNASLGWGVLALLLTPIMAIILLITIIGIPLSLILTAAWLIAIYLSKILVGILVGRGVLNNLLPNRKDSLILAMVIGIVIIYLIFSLPFIGPIISLFAILWGLGGIMLALKK